MAAVLANAGQTNFAGLPPTPLRDLQSPFERESRRCRSRLSPSDRTSSHRESRMPIMRYRALRFRVLSTLKFGRIQPITTDFFDFRTRSISSVYYAGRFF